MDFDHKADVPANRDSMDCGSMERNRWITRRRFNYANHFLSVLLSNLFGLGLGLLLRMPSPEPDTKPTVSETETYKAAKERIELRKKILIAENKNDGR